ncbi:hypothetical protein GF351_05460 [Candidatus Woesearchaeota archaeon]|nr:hypothetical protein [Candidatus Woesearchaeota archaeon]
MRMTMEILSETSIPMAELKDELASIKKRDEELNFRASKTEEYLNQFVELDAKKAKELYDKIDKLKVPRLKEQHINKVIDLLPTTVDSLKVLLQGYTLTVNSENMKKIVAVVQDFVK